VVDITGGAPELNPHFRWFVHEVRGLGRHVIDRCNLTVLLTSGQEDLPGFFAREGVEVIASLPCYLEQNVDAQRGDGVFERSITALRRLNACGYGQPDSGHVLNLVYNPLGPSLPPPQEKLEADYRRELAARYGVVFNRLYTIANMPISRFLDDLLKSGRYEAYLDRLLAAFNPAAAAGVMCRTTLSVDWQGKLYDCDFNQMLDLGLRPELPQHIGNFDPALLNARRIVTGRHCYGCTAGDGSSCQGTVVTGLPGEPPQVLPLPLGEGRGEGRAMSASIAKHHVGRPSQVVRICRRAKKFVLQIEAEPRRQCVPRRSLGTRI
jgi:radical SAM/Cys-rich protein